MESNTFLKLFTRNTGSDQQLATLQEQQQPKRVYHTREVDPDLEVISQLDETIAQRDRDIERYGKLAATLTTQINALKGQHNALKNKEGVQAKEILSKATKLMHERATINKRIANYEQQRLTLSTQVENHRNVKEAERMSKLLQESTLRMQGSMATLDMGSVSLTASDARLASNQANNVSAMIFNPFDMSPDEQNSTFLDEFNALEIDGYDTLEDPVMEKQPFATTTTAAAMEMLPKATASSTTKGNNALLIEDDLY